MLEKLRLLFGVARLLHNPLTYFRHKFGGIASDTVTYATRSGMLLTVRTRSSDRNVFNDIWLDGVYDLDGDSWQDFQTIVDVGAHIGMFTTLAAVRAPHARILALEPEESNLAVARRNIDQNNLQGRVTMLPVGLAAQPGTMRLNVSQKRGEQNSSFRQVEDGVAMQMPVTTLERVFAEHNVVRCDFLKINCEGGEYDVFYSAPPAVLQRIDRMAINYHLFSPDPSHHPQRLIAFLESHGFTVEKKPHEILLVRRTV